MLSSLQTHLKNFPSERNFLGKCKPFEYEWHEELNLNHSFASEVTQRCLVSKQSSREEPCISWLCSKVFLSIPLTGTLFSLIYPHILYSIPNTSLMNVKYCDSMFIPHVLPLKFAYEVSYVDTYAKKSMWVQHYKRIHSSNMNTEY